MLVFSRSDLPSLLLLLLSHFSRVRLFVTPGSSVHGISYGQQEYWSGYIAISFSSGPHSVRSLHHDPPILGCPTGMAVLCWSSHEKIPHAQGKRNRRKMVGVARGHQRANTLKPYSQKTSQSNHTRTTALSNSMKQSHARGATQDGWVMVERSDGM